MPGLVAGLQRSGSTIEPIRIGMLWLDAHPDFNTPETTRSGSLGGMPVAVATGRALHVMRRDAKLDPPMSDQNIVMGGVRLTDPLEQRLLDDSRIEQLSVDDLRNMTPAVWQQLDRLNRISDKLYIHIDMDVLDPREVMAHGNKVPERPVERAARAPVRGDLQALSEGIGDRLRDHSADRRRRPVDRRAQPDDRRRGPRRAARGRSVASADRRFVALTFLHHSRPRDVAQRILADPPLGRVLALRQFRGGLHGGRVQRRRCDGRGAAAPS